MEGCGGSLLKDLEGREGVGERSRPSLAKGQESGSLGRSQIQSGTRRRIAEALGL